MQRLSLFYSSDASYKSALSDEIKCYFLHHHLIKLSNLSQSIAGDDSANRFTQFVKQFERSLVINSRMQAITVGIAFVNAGYIAICPALNSDERTSLLAEVGIARPEQSIKFSSLYLSTQHQLDALVKASYQAETHHQFADIIVSLAKCKAFLVLRKILDTLPEEALVNLKHTLDIAFFYTVHFGDDDMMKYLLNRGVSPHVIDSSDPDEKQIPLVLIIKDMYRFMLRMQKRVENVHTGKLLQGTLADLERVFDARLHSYHAMITTLLEHGADPEQSPDDTFTHASSPKTKAESYLAKHIPALLQSEFYFKAKTEEIAALLRLVAEYQPEAAASSEPTAKLVRQ